MSKILKMFAASLIVLSLLIVTACGGGKDDSNNQTGSNSGNDNQPAQTTKIKFSSFQSGDVAKDWEEERFPAFMEKTGISVEHVYIKSTETIPQLLMLNASNAMPDAGMLSAYYQRALAAKGLLVNLTEFIAEHDPSFDLDRFFPKLVDAYRYNGDIYALPSDLDLGLLYYNKEIFDEAGLPYPDETWTWDDYLNAAKQLTKGEGPGKVYGTEFPDYPQVFLWQNGADVLSEDGKTITIDSPEAIEAITFISDLVNKHGVAPKPGTAGEGEDRFQMGKAAMRLGYGPWYAYYGLRDVQFEWGIAPLPKGKQKSTTAYGSSFAIFEASKNKEAAWEFIKWFLSDEQQLIRAQKFSWFPPSSSVVQMPEFEDESVLSMTKEQKQLVMDETKYGRAPIVVEKQNELDQIINRELSLVWNGEKKPEDAVKVIKEEGQPLLQ
jgi:multiple sugar transport system substrate-binding protein